MFQFMETLNKDFDQGDQLSEFFTIMTNFTHGKQLPLELRERISTFMTNKWTDDKNNFLETIEDYRLFDELPS